MTQVIISDASDVLFLVGGVDLIIGGQHLKIGLAILNLILCLCCAIKIHIYY